MTDNIIHGFVTSDKRKEDRGFVFVKTDAGQVFVHVSKAGSKWGQLVEHAKVSLEYETEYNDKGRTEAERYRMRATKVVKVEASVEYDVITKVTHFNPAKGGRIEVGDDFTRSTATLSIEVCQTAGMPRPGAGMPVKAVVVEGADGPVVTSFEWGPKVEAEYAAKNQAPSEEVALKFFNRKGGFGFFIREDGSELHFHISGVVSGLADSFYRDKRFAAGARFKVILEEHRGKTTAKVLEFVSWAPKKVAPEAVVPEGDVVVDDLMAEHAAETQAAIGQKPAASEAKPAKAPRKKPIAESKVEVAPKPKKPAAKRASRANTDAPDGPLAEKLAALGLKGTAPNGETAH